MAPKLTICTISYNRPQELLEMLHSLIPQLPYADVVKEVIILNNGSTEDYSQIEFFVQSHPELLITYQKSDTNLGVSKGKSLVLRKASTPYIMVLDDDAEFDHPGDFKKMVEIMEKPFFVENNTAIVTIGIWYHSTRERQINAFPHKKYEEYKDKPYFLSSYFLGGGSIVRKDAVEKVGYYKHDILYGMEEYDLGYRLLNAGYTLGYDDAVRMWHKESPMGRVAPKEKQALMWHNKARIVWSFLPKKYFYTTNILWGARYLLKTKLDWSGFIANCKKIKHMKNNTPREEVSPEVLRYLKSVEARLWY